MKTYFANGKIYKGCPKCEGPCDGSFLYCIVELRKSFAFDGKFYEKTSAMEVFPVGIPWLIWYAAECSTDVVMWNHVYIWSHKAILCSVVVRMLAHHARDHAWV